MEARADTTPPAVKVASLSALCSHVVGSKPTEIDRSLGVVVHDAPGERTTFYEGGDDIAALGAAIRWASVQKADHLHLLADPAVAGDVARRAGLLSPDFGVSVWVFVLSEFVAAEPVELVAAPNLSDSQLAFESVIQAAGAVPVDDHGRLVAEVDGLEVARVVHPDPPEAIHPEGTPSVEIEADGVETPRAASDTQSDPARLEIGVGQADRELHGLVHGVADSTDALLTRLRSVVQEVEEIRSSGLGDHPLHRVGQQRWLRSRLVADPSLVGAAELRRVPPLRPRETVLGSLPAAAVGLTLDGEPLVVVCSVGVDLDLPAEAADYRLLHNRASKLVLVVPERDRYLVEPVVMDVLQDVEVVSAPEL